MFIWWSLFSCIEWTQFNKDLSSSGDMTVMCLNSFITGIHSSLSWLTQSAINFYTLSSNQKSQGEFVFQESSRPHEDTAHTPGGPHDVFKSATHLSLERTLSSKHNRDRGYKQMVYKRCESSQTDWTELVVSVDDPHCELQQLSQEGHRRVMGFSHGWSEAVTVPLRVWCDCL